MLIELIILTVSVPVGFLLAWMARDELIQGRKWFKVIIIASFLAGIWFFLTDFNAGVYTCAFILIATFVSYWKSFDRKWTRKT